MMNKLKKSDHVQGTQKTENSKEKKSTKLMNYACLLSISFSKKGWSTTTLYYLKNRVRDKTVNMRTICVKLSTNYNLNVLLKSRRSILVLQPVLIQKGLKIS